MTEQEAKTFENGERESSIVRFQGMREARVSASAHPTDCRCEPYRDLFTCKRWGAQGQRVRKGAKAFILPLWIEREKDEKPRDGEKPRNGRPIRARSVLFCRCQVREAGRRGSHPFDYDVPADVLEAERGRKRDNGGRPKPEPKPTKPAHLTIGPPQQWIAQLVFELKIEPGHLVCDAMPHTSGNAMMEALGETTGEAEPGKTLAVGRYDRIAMIDTHNTPAPMVRIIRDMLKPGGVGVALLLDNGEPIEARGATVRTVPVGDIEFSGPAAHHRCIVARITKD